MIHLPFVFSYIHLWSSRFQFITFLFGFTPSYSASCSASTSTFILHLCHQFLLLFCLRVVPISSVPVVIYPEIPLILLFSGIWSQLSLCDIHTYTYIHGLCITVHIVERWLQGWQILHLFFLFTALCSKFRVYDRPTITWFTILLDLLRSQTSCLDQHFRTAASRRL